MKIAYLGLGSWGYSLASLLAKKGHQILGWTTDLKLAETLTQKKAHPRFPECPVSPNISVTLSLEEALDGGEIIVESVTSEGLRPVLTQVKKTGLKPRPLVITSKGIEKHTRLITPEVAVEVLGEGWKNWVSLLSGPSLAHEVIRGLPTSVVVASYHYEIMLKISEIFTTDSFRVYPNSDIVGVALGGALKNVIAIACGASDGLRLGFSARAALITRGLHEICKLAQGFGCRVETLYGLSGMGDLCVTCTSDLSRNFRFGKRVGEGVSVQEALKEIGMVVEGYHTVIAAKEIADQLHISLPITQTVFEALYQGLKPEDAVLRLMERPIKEEHL